MSITTNNRTEFQSKKGFTLVEVLVFISILSLFFITAAASVSLYLSHLKNNEYRILATHYAQELTEWLRLEKESNWSTFVDNVESTSHFQYLSWSNDNGKMGNPSIFQRDATFTTELAGGKVVRVIVKTKVSWNYGGNSYTVLIPTVFSIWE